MADASDKDLLEQFIQRLERLYDGAVVVHGPGAVAAGRPEPTWDHRAESLWLDFTLTNFSTMVDGLVEATSWQRWPQYPPREGAMRLLTAMLEPAWIRRPENEPHITLTLPRAGVRGAPGRLFRATRHNPRSSGWRMPATEEFGDQLRYLAKCEPWALDQMERFVWLLGGRRQLQRFAMLGCWVVSADRFACVLDHPRLGVVGILVSRDTVSERTVSERATDAAGTDEAVRDAVESLVGLDADEVSAWRERGWHTDGVVWSAEPAGVETPWAEGGPPRPGDAAGEVGVVPRWSVRAPSDHPDPWMSALIDTREWVEHPLWASTCLGRFLLNTMTRDGLRVAAAWAMAPDRCVVIESHVRPLQGSSGSVDHELLRELRPEGQRYLRRGSVLTARAPEEAITSRYWERPVATSSPYPQGFARRFFPRNGVVWEENLSPEYEHRAHRIHVDQAQLDRTAGIIRRALDLSR